MLAPSCDARRDGRLRAAEPEAHQLRARRDPELREHLAQVVLDRARAEEELSGHLLVRVALADEARDLQLLRRQLVDRARVALARGLPRRPQLTARALRPWFG